MKIKKNFPNIWKKFDSVDHTCYYLGTLNGENYLAVECSVPMLFQVLFFRLRKKMTLNYNIYNIDPMTERFIRYVVDNVNKVDEYVWSVKDDMFEMAKMKIKSDLYEHLQDVYAQMPDNDEKPDFNAFVFPILDRTCKAIHLPETNKLNQTLKPFFDSGYGFLHRIQMDSRSSVNVLAKISNEGYMIIRFITVTKVNDINMVSKIDTLSLGFETMKKLVTEIEKEETR